MPHFAGFATFRRGRMYHPRMLAPWLILVILAATFAAGWAARGHWQEWAHRRHLPRRRADVGAIWRLEWELGMRTTEELAADLRRAEKDAGR